MKAKIGGVSWLDDVKVILPVTVSEEALKNVEDPRVPGRGPVGEVRVLGRLKQRLQSLPL